MMASSIEVPESKSKCPLGGCNHHNDSDSDDDYWVFLVFIFTNKIA